MADTQTAPVTNAPAPTPAPAVDPKKAAFEKMKAEFGIVPITRNGISLSFALQEEAKGPTQGSQFLFPDSELSVADLVTLIGEDTARRRLNIVFKKGMKEVFSCNVEANNNTFNKEKFVVEAAEYPFVSVSMSALKDEQSSLVADMMKLDPNSAEGYASIKELLIKVGAINKQIAAKARKGSVNADDEEDDAPVATAAASPLPAAPTA